MQVAKEIYTVRRFGAASMTFNLGGRMYVVGFEREALAKGIAKSLVSRIEVSKYSPHNMLCDLGQEKKQYWNSKGIDRVHVDYNSQVMFIQHTDYMERIAAEASPRKIESVYCQDFVQYPLYHNIGIAIIRDATMCTPEFILTDATVVEPAMYISDMN